ncbi:hypothetical protein BJ170DRAFT_680290 [Xylariales sp. AK1849]|nr:hypothetical protein BJ170DRAFT_680290 [Xylariales sp. AK1849]
MAYTVSLLSTCAQDDKGDSSCTQPNVGHWFNPGEDLKLEVACFLAVAYMVSAGCLGLCIILNLLSGCFPSITVWSQVFAAIATIFLFMASIISSTKFKQLRDNSNRTFGSTGLQTALGSRFYIISFITFAMGLLAAIAPGYPGRQQRRGRLNQVVHHGLDMKSDTRGLVTRGPQETAVGSKPGFIRRMTTWNRHNYTQTEKQVTLVHQCTIGPDDDRQGLVAVVEDDLSHEYPDDIAMGAMPSQVPNHERTLNGASTVYDPYSSG